MNTCSTVFAVIEMQRLLNGLITEHVTDVPLPWDLSSHTKDILSHT